MHAEGSEKPHDFAAANRTYFDEHARGCSGGDHHRHHHHGEEARKLGRRNVAAMRSAYPLLFDEDTTEVLDYACGVGMLSQALCPHVKSIVGVDISQASVDQYNANASNQGLTPDEMKAVCTELRGEAGELDDAKFDVVVCCASYHHFPSIEQTTRVLAHFLKPGGSLLVTDIRAAPDGRVLFKETHHHIVPHKHGFTEDMIRTAFDGTGLINFEMKDAFKAKMTATGEDTMWFVARGVKPG
ncbi:S-adenosyl-L-methionine-dependent methyltransferase [Trametes coccinea BRFM310]|uniref:S-adenosyl-L-methionine-dependent methyltransferase n=1 Tax=Trametes coccinea (strain BRFM310) TaxID=1353009 RepID=A0A1Y2ILV0_TRAC3|nr:S-adenosyl-L-methionine-dependent methyltransferase [Trametes coccinea BRFM310]